MLLVDTWAPLADISLPATNIFLSVVDISQALDDTCFRLRNPPKLASRPHEPVNSAVGAVSHQVAASRDEVETLTDGIKPPRRQVGTMRHMQCYQRRAFAPLSSTCLRKASYALLLRTKSHQQIV